MSGRLRGQPAYMASTSSWSRRLSGSPRSQLQRRSSSVQSLPSFPSSLLEPKKDFEELVALQKVLSERFVKLEEGLRQKELLVLELSRKLCEAEAKQKAAEQRASVAEEELSALRRVCAELKGRFEASKLWMKPQELLGSCFCLCVFHVFFHVFFMCVQWFSYVLPSNDGKV